MGDFLAMRWQRVDTLFDAVTETDATDGSSLTRSARMAERLLSPRTPLLVCCSSRTVEVSLSHSRAPLRRVDAAVRAGHPGW
jgi:hypothetical protein